jgi:hypothetical protein
MQLPIANVIWIGQTLGAVHAACLRSIMRQGHRLVMHAYERPTDLPDGTELADANELIPKDEVVARSEHLRHSSDLLRFELLAKNRGLYLDCDVFLLKPIHDADYIFGTVTNGRINVAVLKLPPNCPVLDDLRQMKSQTYIHPWITGMQRFRMRLAQLRGRILPLKDTGPRAMTYFASKHDKQHYAKPHDVFYPIHPHRTDMLFDRELRLRDLVTPRTIGVHLYSGSLRRYGLENVPAACPMSEIIAKP